MNFRSTSVPQMASFYGLFSGAVLVLIDIAGWQSNQYFSPVTQLAKWFVMIGSILFFTLRYRDKIKHGEISYLTSLWFGTLLSLFAGLILSFFTFCVFKFWDTGLFDEFLDMQEKQLISLHVKQAYIDQQISITTPFLASISFTFSNGIWGFIFSLFFSIFAKKSGNPFNNDSIDSNQFSNTDSI